MTVFPQAIGLAATWDPVLHQAVADVTATEARERFNWYTAANQGASVHDTGITVWAPNINIFRDPRWGRGQETYGEDPYLTGTMATAYVRGLQGWYPKQPYFLKTVATLKHFAVHSGPELGRQSADNVVFEASRRGRKGRSGKGIVPKKQDAKRLYADDPGAHPQLRRSEIFIAHADFIHD